MPVLIEALMGALSWLTTTIPGNATVISVAGAHLFNSAGDSAEKISKGVKDSGVSFLIPIVGAILAYNFIAKNSSK